MVVGGLSVGMLEEGGELEDGDGGGGALTGAEVRGVAKRFAGVPPVDLGWWVTGGEVSVVGLG